MVKYIFQLNKPIPICSTLKKKKKKRKEEKKERKKEKERKKKLLEIFVSQESSYFSHNPWQILHLRSVSFGRY